MTRNKFFIQDNGDQCLDFETVKNEMGCEIEQGSQGIRDFLEIPMAGYDITTTLYPPLSNRMQENFEMNEFDGVELETTCHHQNRPHYQRHIHGHGYPGRHPMVINHSVQVQPEHRRLACWTIGSCVICISFIILLIVIVPLIVLLC